MGGISIKGLHVCLLQVDQRSALQMVEQAVEPTPRTPTSSGLGGHHRPQLADRLQPLLFGVSQEQGDDLIEPHGLRFPLRISFTLMNCAFVRSLPANRLAPVTPSENRLSAEKPQEPWSSKLCDMASWWLVGMT